MAMAATSINQHSFGLRVVSEVAVGGGHCILVSECGRSFGYGCNSRWEVCCFFVVVSLARRLMFLLISLCLPTRSMINPWSWQGPAGHWWRGLFCGCMVLHTPPSVPWSTKTAGSSALKCVGVLRVAVSIPSGLGVGVSNSFRAAQAEVTPGRPTGWEIDWNTTLVFRNEEAEHQGCTALMARHSAVLLAHHVRIHCWYWVSLPIFPVIHQGQRRTWANTSPA